MLNLEMFIQNGQMLKWLLEKRRIDENGCWIWTGMLDPYGYGSISMFYKKAKVHRLSLACKLGRALRDDEMALHKPICKSRACFNPDHLYPGNQKDNMRDWRKYST
jgi:hypothetical protein